MEHPNALAWIVNSLDVSDFLHTTVTYLSPCLVSIQARRGDQQLNLLFGPNDDLENPFRDDLQELAMTLTIHKGGKVEEFIDLYDKESNPFSLFVYEQEDGYIRFDEIVNSGLEERAALNQSLQEMRARHLQERKDLHK